jgi:hypothetical protein
MLPRDVNRWILSRFKGTHKKRLYTLSAVVWAFLSSSRMSLASLGRALLGETKRRHKIKRVWRLVANGKFYPDAVMNGLAREAIAQFGALVVALDWVELRGGCRALVASACTKRGRALPVAWAVVNPARFRRSQNAVEDAFMERLAKMLDAPRTCVLADRGFRRATFLALLDRLGFGYVVRVCGKVHVAGARHAGLLEACGLEEGGEGDLGAVEYREDGAARTRLAWRWRWGQKEAWLLATNMKRKSVNRVCDLYARRMEEEESFRDLKSHRFGAALRYVKLTGPERYARLLAVWAVGMWLLFAQGHAAVSRNLHMGLSTASNRRRDLSLITIGRLLIREALGAPRALLRLLAL